MGLTIKVAMVGAGSMAKEHLKAFQNVPGVELVGITSRTRSRAEGLAKEFGIPKVCDSVSSLYQETQAQLVIVTVTELSMSKVALDTFEYPWAVLLEKPAGYHLGDAKTILQGSSAKKRRVWVALNRRFLSSTQHVMNSLKGQAPGAPRYVRIQDNQSLIEAKKYNHPQEVIDHWMFANSIHLVDYLTALCRGNVTQVTPVFEWNQKSPGIVGAKVEYDSGDLGYYECVWNGPGPWGVHVFTPEHRFEMRPLEQVGIQNQGERKVQILEMSDWDKNFKPGFRLQAQAVIHALSSESEIHGLASLEDSMRSMELVHKIYFK